MEGMVRIAAAGALALIASAAIAAQAHGDGLPVPFEADTTGVANPGGDSRYTTIAAGRGTALVQTEVDGGEVERSRFLDGRFTVPVVAYDGSASGLSADGGTLVLIRPRVRFPRSSTTLAIVGAERLRVRRQITLEGDFSFDAISPDGRTIYLIEYVDPRDVNAYQVRAYDLGRDRLRSEPIVDPEVARATMGGSPVTRAASPDGHWAYTLYDTQEPDRPPFIHALDTETGTAACIDLEAGLFNRNQLDRMKLEPSPDGSTLAVAFRGDPVALVDTETFAVTEPPVDAEPSAADSGESGGPSWILLGVAGLGTGVLVGAAVRTHRRRRAGAIHPGELERLVDIDGNPERSEGGTQAEEGSKECEPVG